MPTKMLSKIVKLVILKALFYSSFGQPVFRGTMSAFRIKQMFYISSNFFGLIFLQICLKSTKGVLRPIFQIRLEFADSTWRPSPARKRLSNIGQFHTIATPLLKKTEYEAKAYYTNAFNLFPSVWYSWIGRSINMTVSEPSTPNKSNLQALNTLINDFMRTNIHLYVEA